MRLLVAASALTLSLFAQAAFGFETCTTGCGTSEPCYDGYCVDLGWWEPCGEWWVIVQECRPYGQPAASGVSVAPQPSAAFSLCTYRCICSVPNRCCGTVCTPDPSSPLQCPQVDNC